MKIARIMRIAIPLLTVLWCYSGMAFQNSKGLEFSEELLFERVKIFSSDAFEGRMTGEHGNKKGRAFISDVFKSYGIQPFYKNYEQTFSVLNNGKTIEASNVIGLARGSAHPEKYIVISAHHDHIGKRGDEIYNGADDNASGIGALFAFAEYLSKSPPEYSVILAAFDAEEMGLHGSRYFVKSMDKDQILLNINIDMIGRSPKNELYMVGSRYNEHLNQVIKRYKNPTSSILIVGHDGTDHKEDWTLASDHAPFHEQGTPFLYFGNEDHEAYHQPEDEFQYLTLEFYSNAITVILSLFEHIDRAGLN